MLSIEKVNAAYGSLQVLWDVSFEVREGEIVTIIGSNGAGKSTIAGVVMGLLKPLSGRVRFNGEDITHLSANERVRLGISLVPEGREIFPKMSVMDNLLLGAYTVRSKAEVKDRLKWVYDIFPKLKEREAQLAGTLSGGEQQMLAIARSLMANPRLLILDEPSLGLAPIIVIRVFEIIERLNREGVTILLSAQNVFRALEMASRAYVLESGRVTMEGRGRELLENPHVKEAYLGV
ncbi:ABC transporter ATP-binding protein [Candidatus Pyrohabitans sp.]